MSTDRFASEAGSHPAADVLAAELGDDARDALECIEKQMRALAQFCHPLSTPRSLVGIQLLRASCDQGRALNHLLADNPMDFAGAALTLHRSQIELYLRAVYFSQIADDEVFEGFIANEEGPRERTVKGNWRKIGTKELAVFVDDWLAPAGEAPSPEDGKLGRMVGVAWGSLCGMVHGGKAVLALYRDDNDQIGCSIPPALHFQLTVNTVSITNFSVILGMTLSGVGPEEPHPCLSQIYAPFESYVRRRNERLIRLGITDQLSVVG